MTSPPRVAAALVGGVLLTLGACADDGNDGALRAERAARLAAEFRAAQAATTTSPDVAPASDGAAPATTSTMSVPTVPPVEPTGVVVPVVALDNSFRPQVIEIDVGDEVVWENRGMNEHDALSVDGPGWGVEVEDFQPGDVYAHVFTEPGEYHYYCSIHGNETVGMIGTVIVNA